MRHYTHCEKAVSITNKKKTKTFLSTQVNTCDVPYKNETLFFET